MTLTKLILLEMLLWNYNMLSIVWQMDLCFPLGPLINCQGAASMQLVLSSNPIYDILTDVNRPVPTKSMTIIRSQKP